MPRHTVQGPVYIYAPYAWYPQRAEESVGFPGTTGGCEAPCACWELNPGPLRAASIHLSSAPPPQHTNFGFVFLLPIAFEVRLSVSFNPTSWSILIFILSPPLPSHTAWSTTLLKVLLLVGLER